jgi:hypothetical protein
MWHCGRRPHLSLAWLPYFSSATRHCQAARSTAHRPHPPFQGRCRPPAATVRPDPLPSIARRVAPLTRPPFFPSPPLAPFKMGTAASHTPLFLSPVLSRTRPREHHPLLPLPLVQRQSPESRRLRAGFRKGCCCHCRPRCAPPSQAPLRELTAPGPPHSHTPSGSVGRRQPTLSVEPPSSMTR